MTGIRTRNTKERIPRRQAAIISTARTGIGKAYRGAFNVTEAPVLAGHVMTAAVERAGIDPARHGIDQPDGDEGRAGLKVEDIGLWELNEAFASQCLYCRDRLGIDPDKYNVDGGAIAVGHPFGMTGARLVGHALIEARKRGVQYAVVSMCTAGGMGAAGLFEIIYAPFDRRESSR